MSNLPAPPRRLAIAITAAVASTTLAIGVSAASLMGWFAPSTPPPTSLASAEPAVSPQLILVPITPSAPTQATTPLQNELPGPDVQVARNERPQWRDDEPNHDEQDERDDRDDRQEDDDE